MSIADLLKYAEFLNNRGNQLRDLLSRLQLTKVSTRVVAQSTTNNVEEVTEYTLNPKAVLAEFDENAKELRLVKQTIERLNHTTMVDFCTKF